MGLVLSGGPEYLRHPKENHDFEKWPNAILLNAIQESMLDPRSKPGNAKGALFWSSKGPEP